MVLRSENPWETETRSGLVSIATHKLFVSTSGPPRKPGSPVLILCTGAGSPIATFVRLQKLLSEFIRVYFYDRSGYDRSERGPHKMLTAQGAARELETLLTEGIRVWPPYILLSCSYGGIIAREFLGLHLSDAAIAGMVLAETGTELMYELFPKIPDQAFDAVTAGVDFEELTDFRRQSKLTDEEWEEAIRATLRSAKAARDEDNHGSARALAEKQQYKHHVLSPSPLSVIRCNWARDFRIMYDAGVKMGNGTEQQRAQARAFIRKYELYDDELRAAQLRLSSLNRYVCFNDCGHDVPFRKPEILVEEVRWVLEQAGVAGDLLLAVES